MSTQLPQPDRALVERLRSGDETAFAALVDSLNGRLLGFARTFTSSPPLAEDIVQETWFAVIRGLRAFEGRSSLRTWIFSILARRARTMAAREARRAASDGGANGRTPVEWEPGRGRVGLWEDSPVPWALADPAAIYQSGEALEVVQEALEGLPETQLQVVLLRDVEDLTANEVCNILDISETNQRVLLHRGRSRVRRAIDHYVRNGARPSPAATNGMSAPRSSSGAGAADVRLPMNPGISGSSRSGSEGVR